MARPTPEEIASLLARFDSSSWDEMELRIGDFRLHLSNRTDAVPATAAPAAVSAPAAAAPARAAAAPPPPPPAPAAKVAVPAGAHTVKAPSLGRFWGKPKPSDPAFVSVGATVKAGDVVCLVEVMKLFTQVKTEIGGKVLAVAVKDGEMVEHDDILVVIQPENG